MHEAPAVPTEPPTARKRPRPRLQLGLAAAMRGISFSGSDFDESSSDRERTAVRPQWLVPYGDSVLVISRSIETGLAQPSSGGGYGGGISMPHQLVVHRLSGFSHGLPTPLPVDGLSSLADASAVTLGNGVLVVASRTRGTFERLNVETLEPSSEPTVFAGALTLVSQPRQHAAEPPSPSHNASGVAAATFDSDGDLLLLQPDARALAWVRDPVRVRQLVSGTRAVRRQKPTTLSVSALPPSGLDDELRLGRALFHDARNVHLTGRSMPCALCHVDGREDGLVWEQNGTFRQTPMLAGGRLAETAPYNWLGTAPTLEANIAQTVQHRLDGDGLTKEEMHALVRYLREGLRPVRRPAAGAPALVAEGKAVFERQDVGCASCHPADFAFTDAQSHDIRSVGRPERSAFLTSHGTGGELSARGFSARAVRAAGLEPAVLPVRFNTPSLAYLGLTAPYLHDGSAPTLETLIARNHDRMGATSQLSAGERRALVAYLESL
jgi:cytochrome c peroxidase